MSIKILLKDKIKEILNKYPDAKTSGKNLFEIAVTNILNLRYLTGLDYDDLLDGVVGMGGDEGVDACYLFVNEGLVRNVKPSSLNKSTLVRLEIIQAKEHKGFSTNEFAKTCDGVKEIFTLEIRKFKSIGANDVLVQKAKLIREVFKEAMKQGAEFKLRIHFASFGDKKDVSEKIKHQQEELKKDLSWIKDISFTFWGAQDLFDLSNKTEELISIEFIDQPLDLSEKETTQVKGYAGFVRGNKLIESLIDEYGQMRDELTEGNIRFFLGEDKSINSAIIETAVSDKAENFWAMNNGITIIGENVRPGGKYEIIIDNSKIVNGCQTLHCLYKVHNEQKTLPEKLKVFVKVIQIPVPDNYDIQGDIIKATNLQNKVATASFKANDPIQKNIETMLLKEKIFYERRKNYYKQQGKTGLDVISLEKMAQIMHAIFQKEAIRAVNHTKDLFEDEAMYRKIFNETADYNVYLFAVLLYKRVWSSKNSDLRNNDYSPEEKELISKSLFCLLHITSSIMLHYPYNINIESPKNIFTKKSKDLFREMKDDKNVKKLYHKAKDLFLKCADSYNTKTGKVKNTLFKNRNFDKEYIVPAVIEFIDYKKSHSDE